MYEGVPEIEGKDCGKEDDEVAEELNSDAQPPVGHVADQNQDEERIFHLSKHLSIHSSSYLFIHPSDPPVGHVADQN